MRLHAFLLLSFASLALTGLVPAARAGGPAVCSAKHKRPANLYGSVLSDGLKPALASSAQASSTSSRSEPASVPQITTGAAPATVKPTQVSRAELRASLAPCGRGRA